MADLFKWALRFYKYGVLLFIIGYCVYIVIDDYVFLKYINDASDLFTFLSFQFGWLVFYFIGFSFFYWAIALFVIFIVYILNRFK